LCRDCAREDRIAATVAGLSAVLSELREAVARLTAGVDELIEWKKETER
jgi:hypothetical protein